MAFSNLDAICVILHFARTLKRVKTSHPYFFPYTPSHVNVERLQPIQQVLAPVRAQYNVLAHFFLASVIELSVFLHRLVQWSVQIAETFLL